MKISQVIKGLEKVKNQYGDLECWSSNDDEGNSYNKVRYEAMVMSLLNNEEIICSDDKQEYLDEADVSAKDVEIVDVCIIN